jgi:5-methylthioribose kinase
MDIEKFDQLLAYLRSTQRISSTESPPIHKVRGSSSYKTVLVRRFNTDSWVLKQAANLAVDADGFSDPARVRREALALRHLSALAPPGAIPHLIFEDPEHNLLAMQAVPSPHHKLEALFLAGQVDFDDVYQLGSLIGTIHRESTEHAADLRQIFDDRAFFDSLRIEPYYRYTAQQIPAAAQFLNQLIEQAFSRRLSLVHGDFSPKNILVHFGRLVLLDHVLIHWGDPAFDVGFALAHLLSKAHYLPADRDRFARAVQIFWSSYTTTIAKTPWRVDFGSHPAAHGAACLLARVAGRSTVEYLTRDQRARQKEISLNLLLRPPSSVLELRDRFLTEL